MIRQSSVQIVFDNASKNRREQTIRFREVAGIVEAERGRYLSPVGLNRQAWSEFNADNEEEVSYSGKLVCIWTLRVVCAVLIDRETVEALY